MKCQHNLDEYFYKSYGQGLSKPKLGRILGKLAVTNIRKQRSRGWDNSGYEFEKVIPRIRNLLDPNAD